MPAEITSYTVDVSICSQICRLAIVEAGLPYKNVNVDIEDKMENYSEWYSKINPNFTVPAMKYVDKEKNVDETITDSKDIMYFLAKENPDSGLLPQDEEVQATIKEYMDLFYTKFSFIGGFTFINLMSWGITYKLFILKSKVIVTNRKLNELEKLNPHLKELVAKKRIASAAMKKMA
jgi:glutathione S-transferase